MNDIAKGILAGGWSLVAGWILPTAVNVLLLGFFILPSLRTIAAFNEISRSSASGQAVVVLGISVVIGLVLNALQSPLYRVLEGYLLWPDRMARKLRIRQLSAKHIIRDRLDAIRLRALNSQSSLGYEDQQRLEELSANPEVSRFAKRDQAKTSVQRSLLRERLRRYPIDDAQVAPTRLGNAIRRLEEYGYDRYRLDSQTLWYELIAAAPNELHRQIDTARAGVDFFICLLYGNLFAAIIAMASLGASHAHRSVLLVTAIILIAVTPIWYRLAWITTDDWALAVRALVDLGRKPLAESLGFRIPKELKSEREMWRQYCRFVRRPYGDGSIDLDEFRFAEETDQDKRVT